MIHMKLGVVANLTDRLEKASMYCEDKVVGEVR